MKRNIFTRLIYGSHEIQEGREGERYNTMVRYFYPEFITSLLLSIMPILIDSFFVSYLRSTAAYATIGVTNILLRLLVKSAEAFSVATTITSGQLNGSGDKYGAGNVLKSSLWVTISIGLGFGLVLYAGAPYIYTAYGMPPDMVVAGTNYLRLRAGSIFLMFVYHSFIGFLRGLKNTHVPMYSFIAGTIVFLISDYLLIFGIAGCPAMGIEGSALASILQYATATTVVLIYLMAGPYTRPYALNALFQIRKLRFIKEILSLSWPIFLDKSALAFAYIWLTKMMGVMGTTIVASFCVVHDIENFVFLPAIAWAQVITFMVSNDIGAGRWRSVRTNIRKVLWMALCMTFALLLVCTIFSSSIISLFDQTGEFTTFAVHVFPLISVFIVFDILQVILAASLRGAANVKVVMMVRIAVFLFYFAPISYALSQSPLRDDIKFILIYSSFYLGNAIMSLGFLYQFRSNRWKQYAGVSDD